MRIAVLGTSHLYAWNYLQALVDLPNIDVVGLVEEDTKCGSPLAERFNIPYVDTLPETPEAIIILADAARRPATFEQAAAMVDVILCEIPLAPTLAESERLVQMCPGVCPAFSLRFLPVFIAIKQLLAQNKLGQILSVKLEYQTPTLPDMPAFAKETLLGNIMQAVDLVRWLFDTEIIELYAETGSGLLHTDKTVHDAALLSVMLTNHAYGSLAVSLSLPPSYPAPEDLKLEIIGTDGAMHIDAYRQKIDTHTIGGYTWVNWGSHRISELISAFTTGAPLPTATDLRRAHEVALAVYE